MQDEQSTTLAFTGRQPLGYPQQCQKIPKRKRMMTRKKEINLEWLIPLLGMLSLLLASGITSASKYLWNDELLSFFLLNDPSFPHMLMAWGDKFNQAPPLYFVLGWCWDKLFGSTELSLRLFSSVALGIALMLVWLTLRRTYSFWTTTLATLSVFGLSELVGYHNSEVRMYGLFSATCALGLFLYDRIERRDSPSWGLLAVNSLAHAAIVLTHLYGLFYSGSILVAHVISDRYMKRFRPRNYLSILLGWSLLLPFATTIINQSNNDAKWFTVKSLSELVSYFIFTPRLPHLLIGFLLTSICLRLISSLQHPSPTRESPDIADARAELSLLLLALGFLTVPILAYVITLTIKPVLGSRYIIPTVTTGWPILLAYLTARLFPSALWPRPSSRSIINMFSPQNLIMGVLVLMILIHPLYHALQASGNSHRPGANDKIYGHLDLPIAMEAGHDFLPRFHYASNPQRYFHIRDWETAVNNKTSPFATGDYTHLQALNRNYPFIQSVESKDFLSRFDHFLVINEADQKWFEARIQNNPRYRVRELGVEPGANAKLTVYLVERLK